MDVPVAVTLSDYMTLASELQACCRLMTKVKGAQKLERQIGTEIKFFQSLSSKDEATQAAQLQSSNLSHFAALVHAATHLPGVTRLVRPFPAPGRRHSLEVDVVAHHGRSWVKVVARKGQALHLVWAGQGQFGERDMVQQLREYQQCARHHPVSFHTPRVLAAFYNTLTAPMATTLQEIGVQVWGEVVPVHPDISRMLAACQPQDQLEESEGEGQSEQSEGLIDEGDDDKEDLVCDGDFGDNPATLDRLSDFKLVLDSRVFGDDLVRDGGNDLVRDGENGPACGGEENDLVSDGETVHDKSHISAVESGLGISLRAAKLNSPFVAPCSDFSLPYRSRLSNKVVPRSSETASKPQTVGSYELSSEADTSRKNQLESSDLETDSAQEVESEPSHRHTQGMMETPPGEGKPAASCSMTSAWKLSLRSLKSVGRILLHCPDLSPLGEEEKEESGGEGKVGGGREVVNLDITTLITLVSAVCHGRCRFRFQDKVLDQQAAEERETPTLPDLAAFLQDKDWIVCRSAWEDFNKIVQLLGGPSEQERAEKLLDRLRIVDDKPSERASNLKLRGKVKDRSKVVFGTGDAMQAVTVTANSGFIRAAESQNVTFAVHMHPARALTEQKERTASPL